MVTLFDRNFQGLKTLFLSFFMNFCPIKIDMSGNTVLPQASDFQITIFGIFQVFLSHK